MAHRMLHAFKKKGAGFPDDFLNRVFKEYNKSAGFCAVVNGELMVRTTTSSSLEAFKKSISDDFSDLEALFSFGKTDDKGMVSEDDVQPFEILSDKGKPILACCLQGAFPNKYTHSESAKSPEFFVVKEYLTTKFNKSFALGYARDINKFMSSLSDADVREDLLNLMTGDSDLIFMPVKGEVIHISNRPKTDAFSWGWTTDALGYKEAEYPENSKETGGGMFGALKSHFQGKIADSKKSESDKGPTMSEAGKGEKKEETPIIASTNPIQQPRFYQCPANITIKNEIKEAYRKNAGWVPQSFKNHPKIEIKLPVTAATAGSTATYRAMESQKESTTGTITGSDAPRTQSPPDKFKAIHDYLETGMVKGLLEKNRGLSLADLAAVEAKRKSFFEESGIPLEKVLTFGPDQFEAMGNMNVQALSDCARSLKNAILELLNGKDPKKLEGVQEQKPKQQEKKQEKIDDDAPLFATG